MEKEIKKKNRRYDRKRTVYCFPNENVYTTRQRLYIIRKTKDDENNPIWYHRAHCAILDTDDGWQYPNKHDFDEMYGVSFLYVYMFIVVGML